MTDSDITGNITADCGQVPQKQEMIEAHEVGCTCDCCCQLSESNCQDNLDHDSWGGQMEPEVAKESAKKLLALADEKDAMMVYGHDPDQWRTLQKAPSGFYS